jgi:hypothetical protein
MQHAPKARVRCSELLATLSVLTCRHELVSHFAKRLLMRWSLSEAI